MANKQKSPKKQIRVKTVKKLFACSGNLCAMPQCPNALFRKNGAFRGKIAHIEAASPKGPRYNVNMDDEQRRDFTNLLLVCGNCHDEIDDFDLMDKYPVDKLHKIKSSHETKFQSPELTIIETLEDFTALNDPTYPKSLKGLAKLYNQDEMIGHEDDIKNVYEFADKIRHLDYSILRFALRIAERFINTGQKASTFSHNISLPVVDIIQAFRLEERELKKQVDILEHHQLASAEENMDGNWEIELYDSENGSNPWIDILEFSKAADISYDEFIREFDFALYDDVTLINKG